MGVTVREVVASGASGVVGAGELRVRSQARSGSLTAFLRGLADGPVPRIGQLEKQGFVTRTRFW